MRKWVKGLALATVLAVVGVGQAQPFFGGGDVAARVNGEAISKAEVQAILDARPSPVTLDKEQERAVRKAAVDMLVDDVLMRQFLRQQRTAQPTSADVQRVVDELRDALKKHNRTLEEFLREEKQTEQQLRGDVLTDLQWKAFLGSQYTEAETKAYFEAYKPFFEKVQVKTSHILFKTPREMNQAQREKRRADLENLRAVINNKQMVNGKLMTFEEAARQFSDCPSKDRGGDLGFITYKFMVVEPFARAAFSTQVGEMTGVIQSEAGMHLIKVTGRTEPEPCDYNVMKDIVRKTMAQERNLFRDILESQRKGAKIEILLQ